MNIKSNVEFSELYLVPPHVYKNVLSNVEEETENEIKSLNKRINPNLDFMSKTMRDNRQDEWSQKTGEKKEKKSKKLLSSQSEENSSNSDTVLTEKETENSALQESVSEGPSAFSTPKNKNRTVSDQGEKFFTPMGPSVSNKSLTNKGTKEKRPNTDSKVKSAKVNKRKKQTEPEQGKSTEDNGASKEASGTPFARKSKRTTKKPSRYGMGNMYFTL